MLPFSLFLLAVVLDDVDRVRPLEVLATDELTLNRRLGSATIETQIDRQEMADQVVEAIVVHVFGAAQQLAGLAHYLNAGAA